MPTCLSFARAEPVLCGECGGLCAARPLSAAPPRAAHWEFFPGQSLTVTRALLLGPWCEGEAAAQRPRVQPGHGEGTHRAVAWPGAAGALSCSSDPPRAGAEQEKADEQPFTIYLKVSFNDSVLPSSRRELSE